MLRKISLALLLFISPFSFASSSGGVSDGGVGIPTEIDCEFKDLKSRFIFTVFAPPYDLPSGSGHNSVLMKTIEKDGQSKVDSSDHFPTSRYSVQNDQKTFIIYSRGLNAGFEVSVESQFMKLSQDDRSKLKNIRTDIDWAGYSKSTLSIRQQNLILSGICVFRQ